MIPDDELSLDNLPNKPIISGNEQLSEMIDDIWNIKE